MNYLADSSANLIGEWVQVWVPEYHPEKGPGKKYEWEKVAGFHGLVGHVVECDEDNPTWIMAAFRVMFDDGRDIWCWRRELRPMPKPEGQMRLV